MNINNTQWNRTRYSLYAPFYNIIKNVSRKARKRSIELLKIKPNEKILIVGVGTGLDFEFLPKEVEITAIDLTPAMIEKAKQKAKQLELPANIQVMDAESLSFDSEYFDVVILHLILAVIPDPITCAKEVNRVLKTNGRVVIFDKFIPDGTTPPMFRKIMNIITNTLFTDITRQLGPILNESNLNKIHYEPSMFNGVFSITIATK